MEEAAIAGNFEIVKMLLKINVPITVKAVESSILEGNAKILEALLDKSKIDANSIVFKQSEGDFFIEIPAIHQAAYTGNADIVRVLLKRGGGKLINNTVKTSMNGDGDNALIYTLRGLTSEQKKPSADTLEILKLLQGAGADLNARNKNYLNVKTIANRLEGPFAALITKYLIENGVKH